MEDSDSDSDDDLDVAQILDKLSSPLAEKPAPAPAPAALYAADIEEHARKIKEQFRSNMARVMVCVLGPIW